MAHQHHHTLKIPSDKSRSAVNARAQQESSDRTNSPPPEDTGGPGTYLPIPMIVRYGENKEFYVNPNAGFAGVMQYIREKLSIVGISESDHIELCDEHGKLLNQDDFPNMMFVSSFIKPTPSEATFIPARVERDEHKRVTKLDVLLKDPEHSMPEVYNKLKKEYHIHILDMKAKRKEKAEALPLNASPSPNSKARGVTPLPHSRESSISKNGKGKPAVRQSKEKQREERKESLPT